MHSNLVSFRNCINMISIFDRLTTKMDYLHKGKSQVSTVSTITLVSEHNRIIE